MSNVHPHVCSVIPQHMLDRLAERSSGPVRDAAEATLVQMHLLATERVNTFVDLLPLAGAPPKQRHVYDARGERTLPGCLVRTEDQPATRDIQVNEAFDGAGATWDFFNEVFDRDSIDGCGLRLDSTVHYGKQFQNAMWNGSQIVYGDGDGRTFRRFTRSLAVIGHELVHGLTQYAAFLGYSGETGALNEHLSDAFGAMIVQYAAKQTVDEADWLIGRELLGPGVKGVAIRSMAAPGSAYDDRVLGRDPQPRHMRDYVDTPADHGGVHINSGIPNHAFYRAAKAIGGYSWEVMGRVWYAALTERLTSDDGFEDFARATVDIAGERYSNGGHVQQAIAGAWEAVGIPVPIFNRRRRAA